MLCCQVAQAKIESGGPGRPIMPPGHNVELVRDAQAIELGAEVSHPLLEIEVVLTAAQHVVEITSSGLRTDERTRAVPADVAGVRAKDSCIGLPIVLKRSG